MGAKRRRAVTGLTFNERRERAQGGRVSRWWKRVRMRKGTGIANTRRDGRKQGELW